MPSSSAQLSPKINVDDEFAIAIRTHSFNAIWSKIHRTDTSDREVYVEGKLSSPVLDPNREYAQEALQNARPSDITNLVSAYIDHSEDTAHQCRLLHDSVNHVRSLYRNLHKIIDCFALVSDAHSLTESQCDWAFNIFLEFDRFNNPFPKRGQSFHGIHHHFSQLNQLIHHQLRKAHSRVRLLRCATSCFTACFIGPLSHFSHQFPSSLHPSKVIKKKLAHFSQFNVAATCTYVLYYLDNIDCLVARLYDSVEDDKFYIRFALERDRDRHPIYEVAQQLKKTHHNVLNQLVDLEQQICLCFAFINRARSNLLEEIYLRQSCVSNEFVA